jgi:hypothetical protein
LVDAPVAAILTAAINDGHRWQAVGLLPLFQQDQWTFRLHGPLQPPCITGSFCVMDSN